MDRTFRQIDWTQHQDVFCIRLRSRIMDEEALHQFGEELSFLIEKDGCRKMVLVLGPDGPLCLYSIFLAKLVSLRRRLHQLGGRLLLAHVGQETLKIFEACNLVSLFEFISDQESAIAALTADG